MATSPLWAQSLPIRHKNSTYTLVYEAAKKRLDCKSSITGAVWTTNVSNGIQSISQFAATATPAGPVIVYEEGGQVRFLLLHFKTGGKTVPNSGEPLSGSIGAGSLLSCVLQPEEYGAKAVCQIASSGKIEEQRWDINFWGTHKLIGKAAIGPMSAGARPGSTKFTDPKLKFALEIPRGFRVIPGDEKSCILFGPLPGVYFTVFREGEAHDAKALTESYMKELKLKVIQQTNETLFDGKPALLTAGEGVVNGIQSKHIAIAFSRESSTYVVSMTIDTQYQNSYTWALEEVLRTFKPL